MNDILAPELDTSLSEEDLASDLDSEIISAKEADPLPAKEQEALKAVQDYLNSEEFKQKVDTLLQQAIQKIVPDIAERLIQDEIKRLTAD